MFSRWGLDLKNYDIYTRSQLGTLVWSSYTPAPTIVQLGGAENPVADFSTFVQKYVGPLHGSRQVHTFAFHIAIDNAQADMWHKEWCRDAHWLGTEEKPEQPDR
jgi:hypothetical protein